MATLTTVTPGVVSSAPAFTAVTAADKFLSSGAGGWRIHYRNGATVGTGSLFVQNFSAVIAPVGFTGAVPPGAATPALPTGAVHWDDDLVVTNMAATTDVRLYIPGILIAQFTDTTGFVNLVHNGTITTITVSVEGPF
jgi:Kef-type K+ transport system membrane component KefB